MEIEFAILLSILSAISGLGAYLHSVRDARWTTLGLVSELIMSISVGLCVGYYCDHMGWSKELACALAIIGGNNGSDFLSKIKRIFNHIILKKLGLNLDDKAK